MSLISNIKENPKYKKLFLWFIVSPLRARPRWYIKWFINPFFHKKGKHTLIRFKARLDVVFFKQFNIGSYSTIEDYCVISNGSGDVIIGDECQIGIGTAILGPVTIGKGAGTGQHVFISGFNHEFKDGTKNSKYQGLDIRGVVIEDEVHIGANSVVVAGVTIGKRSQIGAGSVVTKDIPPYSIAAGNPAKVLKRYNFDTNLWEKI
jgi:acetyltransferase-like isoleucine patch superfamily enzyme